MMKKTVSVLLTVLLVLSCCTAGLSALAANDAELDSIYQFLRSANQDRTEDDHNFDDALTMLAGLSSDELIALGKRANAAQGAEFWWAGDRAMHLNCSYKYDGDPAVVRAYCPAVYLEIAERIPAYADFVGVLLDGVTVYSLLIGEPTAEISLSEAERTPFAIGRRMAQLPEGQAGSLKSAIYFGNSDYFSIEGITENLDEDKASDESVGAVKTVTELFPGFSWESVESAYLSKTVLCNFSLCAAFFEKTFTEAEPGLAALENFSNVIEGLNAPYRTKDVEAAKIAYAAVPTTAWNLADERARAARAKYRTILAAAGLEDNDVDLSVYKQTDLGKNELSEKAANEVLDLLRDSAGADEKLGAAIAGLATGSSLVSLLSTIAGANEMLGAMLSIEFVASGLKKDPKFSGAVQKMEALQAEGHNGGFVEYGADDEGFLVATWSAADQFTSADFGFTDGDFYGFADALGGCLSNLSVLLDLVSGFSFKNIADGDTYTVGKYEDLIPLFELLDLPTPSSAAFTKAEESAVFTDREGNTYSDRVRAGINGLFKPVADYLMTTFKAAPLDSLVDILPKVAYAFESGLLNDTLQKLVGSFAALGFEVKLDKDDLWKTVDKQLVSGFDQKSIDGTKTRHIDGGVDLDKDGVKEAVPLTKEQVSRLVTDLAGCAEPVVKPSVSIPHANRLGLNTQKAKVVSVAVAEIIKMETTEDGKAFFDKALDSIGAPGFAKKLLSFAANRGVGFSFMLLDRFLPIVTIVLAVLSFFKKVKALFGR